VPPEPKRRNAIAPRILMVALLAVPEDNPRRRARIVTRITHSAQRMERMIADLLDLTRVRLGGTMPITRRPANLQPICEETVLECRAAHPDAVLIINASANLQGDWDADRLSRVVSNLLGNAIQHGGGTPVTLMAREDGDAVTVAVHNGGAPFRLKRCHSSLSRSLAANPKIRRARAASAWACSLRERSYRRMAAIFR
jgi:signal transduction histidine kinase